MRLFLALACLGGALPLSCAAGHAADHVWAVNIGGPAYTALDGTVYEAENGVSGGSVRSLQRVLGSQDPALYLGYREGEVRIERAVANGTYALTFHFAEPAALETGQRRFHAVAEGVTVIEGLDVIRARDGKAESALTVTVPGIEVADGQLDVRLVAGRLQPVLSALVVRRAVAPEPGAWTRVWGDEFEGEGLPNPERWNIDVWPARVVNDEDQAYTDRLRNLRREDGMLVIEAHKEEYENANYTSARIHSQGKGDFLYGRIEARARVPAGQGSWAAIWMLPSAPFRYATTCEPGDAWQGVDDCDAWPNSGEIDILEHVGYETGHVHGTVHNRAYYWVNWQQRKGRLLVDGVADSFHVYALEWAPQRIDLFVDDVRYFTYVNEGQGWRAWPYDHPFHLVLNLAIGGGWGRAGGPIDDAAFPQRMSVDWVRVFRRAESPAME